MRPSSTSVSAESAKTIPAANPAPGRSSTASPMTTGVGAIRMTPSRFGGVASEVGGVTERSAIAQPPLGAAHEATDVVGMRDDHPQADEGRGHHRLDPHPAD